jgi:fatty-acyl-CoA synthase
MNGLMMEMPLLVSSLLAHADRHHGDVEIVSRRVEGDIHRYTYRDAHRRARQLANALARLGASAATASRRWPGTATATSSSTTALRQRHGDAHRQPAPLPRADRLDPERRADALLFIDLTFVPLVEKIAGAAEDLKRIVLMTDRAHMPAPPRSRTSLCYEELVEAESDDFAWPELDENDGVRPLLHLRHHRQPEGRALQPSLDGAARLRHGAAGRDGALARDCVLPVVPMFHANAWGLPTARR